MRHLPAAGLGFVLLLLAGCSEYGYRYAAHPQQPVNPIFADDRVHGDTLDVLVDTNGGRLDSVSILSHDGIRVDPQKIDYPTFEAERVRGIRDEVYGPTLATGPTIAHFDKAALGPPPWNADIKVQGVPPVTVHLPN